MPVRLIMWGVASSLSAWWVWTCLESTDASWPDHGAVASGPIAEMCMAVDTFLPKNTYSYVCRTTDSEDPAVMADCPAGCEGGDYQVADGTTRYYCKCGVSSEAECAAKYPGECPATEDAAHATPSCDPSATHAGISRSPARYPSVHSWREAILEL